MDIVGEILKVDSKEQRFLDGAAPLAIAEVLNFYCKTSKQKILIMELDLSITLNLPLSTP